MYHLHRSELCCNGLCSPFTINSGGSVLNSLFPIYISDMFATPRKRISFSGVDFVEMPRSSGGGAAKVSGKVVAGSSAAVVAPSGRRAEGSVRAEPGASNLAHSVVASSVGTARGRRSLTADVSAASAPPSGSVRPGSFGSGAAERLGPAVPPPRGAQGYNHIDILTGRVPPLDSQRRTNSLPRRFHLHLTSDEDDGADTVGWFALESTESRIFFNVGISLEE